MTLRERRRPCNLEWELRPPRDWSVRVDVVTAELLASPVALWEQLAGVGVHFTPTDESVALRFTARATTAAIAERIICRALGRAGVTVLAREAKPL